MNSYHIIQYYLDKYINQYNYNFNAQQHKIITKIHTISKHYKKQEQN